jgi:hypothetical protein
MGMMIWLLALVLLASLAALGYRQGAIRVAFSTVGILVGIVLAAPLGRLLRPLLGVVGVKNPVEAWLLGPLIVFVIISIGFKAGAAAVHHKVDVYFKYRAGDLRLALWERLNQRLGLCLGLLNGFLYALLLSFIIYGFSYWTVQVATSESDPRILRILNQLGQSMQSSGFDRVARAVDPLPRTWYETADLAGILYNNSLLQARLARYPAFLGLAERPEFQGLGNDKDFTEAWQRHDAIMTLLNHPMVQNILNNPDLLRLIWATVTPDISDLRTYFEKGDSPKYDAIPLVGRWKFDLNAAFSALRRARPTLPSSEMQKLKKAIAPAFAKTTFVAMVDHQALLKDSPPLKTAPGGIPPPGTQALQGQWKEASGKYQLSLSGAGAEGDLPMTLEGGRLTIKVPGMDWVFDRED